MLVLAAQAGDSEAFAELFRRHYPMVRRVCARKLRALHEADEVAQAAFVRAYERLDRCNGDRRFGAWVQVIANNMCIDHMRDSNRTTPSDEPMQGDAALGPNSPEDTVLRSEQAAMIQKALASLPDRQRDVVVARDMDGRRPPEIAAALGLSLGAVDSLLLRARRRLAASVQSMTAESGAASMVTTAAVAAVGSTATQLGPISRFAQALGEAVASASFHVASSMGMVPGVPSAIAQAAPAAAAGFASLLPLAGVAATPAVPAVPVPIVATVPTVPHTAAPNATTLLPTDPTSAIDAANSLVAPVTATVPTAPAVTETPAAPTLLGNATDAVSHTAHGASSLLGDALGSAVTP
ncbi:MAG: polymerase sigma-70 factor, subfamily [Actinomycetota bacterium]